MKAEKKELLVSVLNEKITVLKSDVLQAERAIAELEEVRSELVGGNKEGGVNDQRKSLGLVNKTKSPQPPSEKGEKNTSKPGRTLKIVKAKTKGADLKGKPAPFKSCYKNVFWNTAQGKWNGQVPNPNGGPPVKLTKSSDNIEDCANFVVETLGLQSVEDVFIEI